MRWFGKGLAFGIFALLVTNTVAACGSGPYGGNTLFVPLRWCVMEGSSDAGTHGPGQVVNAKEVLFNIVQSILANEAGIRFRPQLLHGFDIPVIRDPNPPPGSEGQLGDVNINFGDPYEAENAATECRNEWSRLDPGAPDSLVYVTARKFIHPGPTLGVSSKPDFGLWTKQFSPLTGHRGDDLCGDPRHLKLSDVDHGYSVVPQRESFSSQSTYIHTLAHEFGHALTLGHGNGIDDNGDGKAAGTPGPRRFDEYCDPLGVDSSGSLPVEDHQTHGLTCGVSESLMEPQDTPCFKLSALQIEQVRAVAATLASAGS